MRKEKEPMLVVTKDALIEHAIDIFKEFSTSHSAMGFKVEVLGADVITAKWFKASLVILKLHALEMDLELTKASYVVFLLAHTTGFPAELLFPLGYRLAHSLEEMESFIEDLRTYVAFTDAEAMSGIANA